MDFQGYLMSNIIFIVIHNRFRLSFILHSIPTCFQQRIGLDELLNPIVIVICVCMHWGQAK